MTRQRVLLDGLPHGKAKDGKLRVSVHVALSCFRTGNAVSTPGRSSLTGEVTG